MLVYAGVFESNREFNCSSSVMSEWKLLALQNNLESFSIPLLKKAWHDQVPARVINVSEPIRGEHVAHRAMTESPDTLP